MNTHIVTTDKAAYFHINAMSVYDIVYMDTETTGLDPHTYNLLIVSAVYGDQCVAFDMTRLSHRVMDALGNAVLKNPTIKKVFHNATFDAKAFLKYGIRTENMACTFVAEQLLTAGYFGISCSLGAVSERRLGRILKKDIRNEFINFEGELTEAQLDYALEDVDVLVGVYAQQQEEMDYQDLLDVYDVECNNLLCTALMEYVGIEFDADKSIAAEPHFHSLHHRADQTLQMEYIRRGFANKIIFHRDGITAINTASDDDMRRFFNLAGINVKTMQAKELTAWDMRNTNRKEVAIAFEEDDEDFNMGYNHPLLKLHGIRVATAKIVTQYITGLRTKINPVTGRIHPSFIQCGAALTGRYSSRAPNFQNIIKKDKLAALGLAEWDIRSMFRARNGYSFIICDYSAIELVITACYSNDEILLNQIATGDVHSYVATYLFGIEVTKANKGIEPYSILRDCAKTATYAILYGTTGRNLEETLSTRLQRCGIRVSAGDGDKWIANWRKAFPVAGKFLEQNAYAAVTLGYVKTIMGRRRRWDTKFANKWAWWAAQREGSNSAIQGSSADMLKKAMNMLFRALPIDTDVARIAATVHDELILEVRDDVVEHYAGLCKHYMEEAGNILFSKAREYGIINAEPKISKVYDK